MIRVCFVTTYIHCVLLAYIVLLLTTFVVEAGEDTRRTQCAGRSLFEGLGAGSIASGK